MRSNQLHLVDMEIDFDGEDAEPSNNWPLMININKIYIFGCEATPEQFQAILAEYGDEIKEDCADDWKQEKDERAFDAAEYRAEAMRHFDELIDTIR